MANLIVNIPDQQPAQLELGDIPIRIGRHESNDVCVPEADYLSGFHAELFKAGEGYILRDLGSSNGTYVNGQKIEQIYLNHQDRILFGILPAEYQQAKQTVKIDHIPTHQPPPPNPAQTQDLTVPQDISQTIRITPMAAYHTEESSDGDVRIRRRPGGQ